MEDFARSIRRLITDLVQVLTPHLRQVLRFLALPYCYFFLVNWEECTASRRQVILDFIYIFFVLRYFPDNYSKCRFFELERKEWAYYYGSNYNPYQRGKLVRFVQPQEYQVVFEDKEVCQKLCEGHGITVPPAVGVLDPQRPTSPQITELVARSSGTDFFAKPVRGSAGKDVLLIRKTDSGFVVHDQKGPLANDNDLTLKERYLVQEKIQQHEALAEINGRSVNTVRVLTLYTASGNSIPFAALVRFGVGTSHIDNWSAGGIGIGIDLSSGRLGSHGLDRKGCRHLKHPDSGVAFSGFQLPLWDEVMAFSAHVQDCFPFYRLLGLDVAISNDKPVLIEINAFPDFVGAEQKTGPFLRNPVIYREFDRYDLFINRRQKDLVMGSPTTPGGDS